MFKRRKPPPLRMVEFVGGPLDGEYAAFKPPLLVELLVPAKPFGSQVGDLSELAEPGPMTHRYLLARGPEYHYKPD